MMDKKRLTTAILVALAAFCASTLASESAQGTTAQDEPERIEVLGNKPPEFYLKQLRERRDDFFDHFNQLVEKDLRIHCRMISPRDPKYSRRERVEVCEPHFVFEVNYLETQQKFTNTNFGSGAEGFFSGLFDRPPSPITQKRINVKKQTMLKKMVELVSEDTELKQKYVVMNQAQALYEAAKQAQ